MHFRALLSLCIFVHCYFLHFHAFSCIFMDCFYAFSWILIHFHAFLCIFTRFCLYALSSSRNFPRVVVSPAIFFHASSLLVHFFHALLWVFCAVVPAARSCGRRRPAAGCLGVLGIKSPKGGLGKAGRVLLRLLPKYPILGKKWGSGGLQQQLPGLTRR